MMENVHRQCSENTGYDVEFYSTNPTTLSQNSQIWKNQDGSIGQPLTVDPFSNNNNHLSSNSDLNHSSHGFSINVSTGESDLFIDELIELADESMTSSATSSSVMSTPSPVMVPQSKYPLINQHEKSFVRSAPPAAPAMPYHSRLHEALTQPRLPTQPVRCHRCGNELTSRCLMQVCSADDTRCRQCGQDLTAKCILAVCTVPPKVEGGGDFERRPSAQLPPAHPPRRQRVHHYSSPSPSTSKFSKWLNKESSKTKIKSNLAWVKTVNSTSKQNLMNILQDWLTDNKPKNHKHLKHHRF